MKHVIIHWLLALFAIPFGSVLAATPERPNILFFYVDDMGWGAIGPNGQAARRAAGRPSVLTPNLDRLAAEGVNFTRGYGCTVCSPARSSLQTGFHQGHTFADRNDPNNAKKAIRKDDVCIGDVLSEAGYTTGYWGKWGYGGSKDQANPVIENVQTLPTSHGFHNVLAELHHVRAHTFYQPTLWKAPATPGAIGGLELVPNSITRYRNSEEYPQTPALQNHAAYPKTAYCDDSYALAALDFVRKQGVNYNASGQPFFGLLAVQIPHAPFGDITALPEWNKAYENDPHYPTLATQTQQWAAMVTRIDAHFGNLLAALEDPNNDGDRSDSIADNTLVIFQSDNGGPSQRSNNELDANGGLRGAKGSIYEGGIRVPLVMRWPAKITTDSRLQPGNNCDQVVDVTDLLPTFCELAGVPHPVGIDGVSIAPTLLGRGHQRQREFIIHEAGNAHSIIRGGHKLVRSVNDRRAKQNKTVSRVTLALYDLNTDPAESQDIAADNPQLVQELERLLLGERVAEPKGFANTYHSWTGEDGASASDPANWSDYEYANAGITYMTDDGPPKLSWTASIRNAGNTPNTAKADTDLEFLGLEIAGNAAKQVTQSLVLDPQVNLMGRNEIRLASHGILSVNRGTVSSLRWLEIFPDGILNGTGTIDTTLFNSGLVNVAGADRPRLNVTANYHQSANGTLSLPLSQGEQPSLKVSGLAHLDGLLKIVIGENLKPTPGKIYIILRADRLHGRFSNPRNQVIADDGTRLTIYYLDSTVAVVCD